MSRKSNYCQSEIVWKKGKKSSIGRTQVHLINKTEIVD